MIAYIQPATTTSGKKYKVTLIWETGRRKTLMFGADGYSDYTKHKDITRKRAYDARHNVNENWGKSGIETAGFWSKWILWNKPTLGESITHTIKKFNIHIKRNKPPNKH
jgi:hypothetical protein